MRAASSTPRRSPNDPLALRGAYYPKGKVRKRFAKLVPIEKLQVSDGFFFGAS